MRLRQIIETLSSALLLCCLTSMGADFRKEDVVVSSDGGKAVGVCKLGATILFPRRVPRAVVLLVHGSGTHDRDERIGAMTPFKDIAEALSSADFITFRFDKRGSTSECSPPLKDNRALSPWNFVQDVRNLASYISGRADLKRYPLFLLGHSEGVNFVVETALRDNRVKGLILAAGLGKYPIDKTVVRQLRQLAALPGLTPEQKKSVEKQLGDGERLFSHIRSGTSKADETFWGTYRDYWKDWMAMTDTAAASAARVSVPSLVLWGDQDVNVTAQDFAALRDATRHVSGSQARLFPGLEHLFTKSGGTHVDGDVLTTIIAWTRSVTEDAH